MQDFDFHRPKTLSEARDALAGKPEAKLLGGGQSLLPVMKLDLAAPTDVVALSGIDELRGIRVEGNEIVVGALATHAEVESSDVVRDAVPGLAELASAIGDPQVRNRGTLGGSLAHADPAADYPAAVLALGATVVTDRREIAADDFFVGLFETALEDDEIITAVRFPTPDRGAYAKFASPASRFAIVGVFVATREDEVRVAVTGAGPVAFRVTAMEDALAADFSADAIEGISVPHDDLNDDLDAGPEYRAHLVSVMARRAVTAAA